MSTEHIPYSGCAQAHIWNLGIGKLLDMGEDTRKVLAANLLHLMGQSELYRTIKQLSEASGVSTGTIDRIRRAEVSAGVDNLASLAAPFGLEAWQLLTADPKATPETPDIQDLVMAFTRFPDAMQQEILRDFMRLAVEYNDDKARATMKKHGLDRTATAARVASHIGPAPKSVYTKVNRPAKPARKKSA